MCVIQQLWMNSCISFALKDLLAAAQSTARLSWPIELTQVFFLKSFSSAVLPLPQIRISSSSIYFSSLRISSCRNHFSSTGGNFFVCIGQCFASFLSARIGDWKVKRKRRDGSVASISGSGRYPPSMLCCWKSRSRSGLVITEL